MKRSDEINKRTEAALNSLDDATQASPPPYLLTRINSRLNQAPQNWWDKAVLVISRPGVAFGGLIVLIMMNVFVIIQTRPVSNTVAGETIQVAGDEFSNTVATIYDNENP